MKKYYVLLCLFFSTFLLAQVGINTTTPNAQLHIQSFNQAAPSNTDGLLIPKVDTFPVTNPTIDQQGMLVYLTTNVGSNPPGFYYWNNPTTSWIPIGNNNNNNWNLTGNLGADDTTNFIGTLDNTPLNFRVNNSNVGKFNSSLNNYAIGLNTLTQTNPGTQSIAIGTGAGRFQQTGTFGNIYMGHLAGENNATGLRNTFIGFSAARNNTSASNCTIIGFNAGASSNGSSNTFLGFASGFANTTSGLNTFIGASSGQSNTTGDINTYIGALSGSSNITGQNNTFLGHQSGVNNVSGNDNLFLGQLSGQNNTIGSANTAIGKSTRFLLNNLNNATAIGNLAAVGSSNSLVLGSINGVNGATADVNVGVGTTTPLEKLHVVGSIRMVDGNEAVGRVMVSNANGTATWTDNTAVASGTLDQAYDFGGAGNGRTITADAGAVTINGTDGFVSTGTINSGAIAPSGTGIRMVWNPRKAAFRAGNVVGTNWDDASVGTSSVALGNNPLAVGLASVAIGNFVRATGTGSSAFGTSSSANGQASTVFGRANNADASESTAFGYNNTASSYGETVLGLGATFYTPSTNGAFQFGITNATDRLFVIGNAIDSNNNSFVDAAERSDAMVVLKNGLTRLPSTTNTMIDASDGKAVVTKEYLLSNTSGTLDQAYDFGGAGLGRTITADAGAITINGTDGLVTTGTAGSGALAPSGSGVKMFWNPRKAAFRAGQVTSNQWDDTNIGINSIAMGFGTRATGNASVALGNLSSALGMFSVAFGTSASANATQSTAFGNLTAANGIYSTAFGYETSTTGRASTSFGVNNEAESFGEVVLGIGATTYTPSTNGANQFRSANATDRLFVVGNAIDVDNDDIVDDSERSNALVILKNGNTGIGSSTPGERLHVAGRSLFTNGFSTTNAALLYQNNTDYMFIGPQSGSSANGAAIALFGSTNTSGGNAGGLDINVPNALVRMNHTNGNFTFGTNSTSGYTGAFELNDNGLEIGHNSASRAILFNPNSTERMRLTPAGNLGVGTNNPLQKLHVSGPAGLTAVRIANTSGTGSTSNVALDFFRNTAANTDWRIYNIGANLTIGNSGDDLTTVNDLYQYQGVRFMPMNDATQNLGQATNRWNTLFASNGTINTSDAREKKNIQNLNYGLNALMQLRPVSFEWKKDDGSGTKLGLIAQELQQVVPEVVRDWDWEEDEHGNRNKVASPILGVYYSDLIPVLIKATQEQQVIIEQQKQEIELLKQQFQEQYKSIVERLEKIENK